MAGIFEELRNKVKKSTGLLPAERRAMFWFQSYSTELTTWQTKHDQESFDDLKNERFTKQVVGANAALPGFLYFFLYSAKHKETLPYWDAFPFTLVLKKYDDGFLGLNFHYLDYRQRATLFDALYPLREGRNPSKNEDRSDVRDIRMRLQVTYEILKNSSKYAPYKPCVKRYLTKYVRSNLLKVGAKEWDISLFLPVHQFRKETASYVWRESRKKF